MSHPILSVFPADVVARLDEIEARLRDACQSRDPQLSEWSRAAVASGGKRVRPLLLLTAFHAALGPGETGHPRVLDAAVAVELVHTASLVHDDIMDESPVRRGAPSIYAAQGRDAAILVGDFLFTQAFAVGSLLPKAAMDHTADACRRLCEGQLREQALLRSGHPDRTQYTAVIRDKTASLLAASCAVGGVMAGASEETVAALHRYGNAIGHAFQVLDDVLDVTGDPQWTGKPAGTDYLAGNLSSPYLHYVERGGELPAARKAQDFPRVRGHLFESGAVAASQLEAGAYTQAALLDVSRMRASPARHALERLGEILMERAA